MQLTAANIVHSIGNLPRTRCYNYVEKATTSAIEIIDVVAPEGPIVLRRYDPKRGGRRRASKASISVNMIARVANAIRPNQPINIDRILGASYNTRSALEALLAHTPEFWVCRPGRIEMSSSTTRIKKGHKHLLWLPDDPHEAGLIRERHTDVVISEVPSADAVYEALEIPSELAQREGIDVQAARRHAQIQIALVVIGRQLGFRSWVARNDRAILYNNSQLGEMDGVVIDLEREALVAPHEGAVRAALYIDCIWFRNSRFLPAVIEIEHTTGVTSGLHRMKTLFDLLPRFPTRWVIAAPDEARSSVIQEANKEAFRPLRARFFPYSAIEELYSLCQRRHLTRESVNEEFLDAFMEPCTHALAH